MNDFWEKWPQGWAYRADYGQACAPHDEPGSWACTKTADVGPSAANAGATARTRRGLELKCDCSRSAPFSNLPL